MKANRIVDKHAAQQFGVISRKQALELGLSEYAIFRRLESEKWHQLCPGVYAMASSVPTWERQLQAAVLSRDAALVAGSSAALLHGLDGFRPGRPVIMVPVEGNARSRVARIIRSSRFDDIGRTRIGPFLVTSVAETLWTLAREISRPRLFDLVDTSLVSKKTTIDELGEVLSRVRSTRQRGLSNYRDAVLRASPDDVEVATNKLELALYRLLSSSGVPPVSRQEPFLLPSGGARLDAYIPAWQLDVEADGRTWHIKQSDFERDRARDNELASMGVLVLRFTYRMLANEPERCLETLLRTGHHRSAPSRV